MHGDDEEDDDDHNNDEKDNVIYLDGSDSIKQQTQISY